MSEVNSLESAWKALPLQLKILSSNAETLCFDVNVKAKPGAKLQKIFIDESQNLAIAVSARPVEGAANKAITKFCAKILGLSTSCVEIISGEKSKQKAFRITYNFSDHKGVDYYLDKLTKALES